MSRKQQLDVSHMADLVCDAAQQAALDGVESVLAVAAVGIADAPDRARDIASQVLCRATVMQSEIARFVSAIRGRR